MPGGPVKVHDDVDSPFTPERPRASWGARVIAVLLDSAIISSVVFLATGAAVGFTALPSLNLTIFINGEFNPTVRPPEAAANGAGLWMLGTLLVLGIFQAYTGRSVGKRVCGIAVVDAQSGRPIGFLGTVLRFLAHVLDSILFIGYLRALFNAEGRTFADSLLGTVAIRTKSPLPHPWVARLSTARDEFAPWLRWPTAVTGATALVLCAGAAAMSMAEGGGSHSTSSPVQCPVDVLVDSPGDVVNVTADTVTVTRSRLGIDRVTGTSWAIRADWLPVLDSYPPAGSVMEMDVRSPSGAYAAASATAGGDGGYSETYTSVIGAETGMQDMGDGLVIESNESLEGWIVTSQITDPDGVVRATCTGRVPMLSDR